MTSLAHSPSTAPRAERRRLRVTGIVQGVGFRPFVAQLATSLSVAGLVGNDSSGVFIEIEGPPDALDRFSARLVENAPPLARIDAVHGTSMAARDDVGFEIVESEQVAGARTLVPPDVATCADCLADIADPTDRRYRYPFTNCTNCGPRFTIIRDLPYDRAATTMSGFEMCGECAAEFADPLDRRYHAQPVACPACGPRLEFERSDALSAERLTGTDEVIAEVHAVLADGGIVAVKGLGGYHLACDAGSDDAIHLLRERKRRAHRPFAVMVPDLPAVARVADIDPEEASLLESPARPIVLVRRRADPAAIVSERVAPGNPLLGVMLPYTPLHHLLFARVPGAHLEPPRAVVLTSGNLSDEPICFDDDDARARLAELADAFCTHDRPIEVPCDDSVVRVVAGEVQPVRRSRGYAPVPVSLPVEVAPVVAAGGELKNTCCVAVGTNAWVGQHIGDMENLETLHAFGNSVAAFGRMYDIDTATYAVDRHPGYLTRRWALEAAAGRPVIEVQHHHAHVAALMAEHGIDRPVLGFAFDGTGYGTDDEGATQIWGGEVLRADFAGFERVAHLMPLPLPGGDEAIRNPCRIAVAWLTALELPLDAASPPVAACDPVEVGVVQRQVERDVGCVPTTSMGRLFDVVSSLLDVRQRVDYEAQAAIELEAIAASGRPGRVELQFGVTGTDGAALIDPRPVLGGLLDGRRDGRAVADLALAFHVAVADVVAVLAERFAGGDPVGLTGGVFQNALLTTLTQARLEGFDVLTHRSVPANDGGLSLGQAVIAGRRLARRGEE